MQHDRIGFGGGGGGWGWGAGGIIGRYRSCKIYIGPQLLELSSNEGWIGGVRMRVVGAGGELHGIRGQGMGAWMGLRGGGGLRGSLQKPWCHSVCVIRAIDGL